jgi:hypothetical protein
MTLREARDAFMEGFRDAFKLYLALVSAPFVVIAAFVRHQDFQFRQR